MFTLTGPGSWFTNLTVPALQDRGPALCAEGSGDEPPVTLVNFRAGEGGAIGAHGAIPGDGEEAGVGAAAEAVGALPTHPDGFRGGGDAPGAGEGFEEGELPGWGPAVDAEFGTLHRPAWSTREPL